MPLSFALESPQNAEQRRILLLRTPPGSQEASCWTAAAKNSAECVRDRLNTPFEEALADVVLQDDGPGESITLGMTRPSTSWNRCGVGSTLVRRARGAAA